MQRKAAAVTATVVDQHGTTTQYRNGCRCDDCRQANTDYSREMKARIKKQGLARPVPQCTATDHHGRRCLLDHKHPGAAHASAVPTPPGTADNIHRWHS